MKYIKIILICLLFVVIATGSIMADSKNNKTTENHNKNSKKTPVSKLVNNGKILSDFGFKNILDSEVSSIMVSKDTIFITITETAFKRIDRDSRNYIMTSPNIKRAKTKKNR